jgi:signal transduction histidine kinase
LDAPYVRCGLAGTNTRFGANLSVPTRYAMVASSTDSETPRASRSALNLALNARDVMANGGSITIEASNSFPDDAYIRKNNTDVLPGQYVQIAITDTGTGMSEDVIERAFEPFFTTKPSGQGARQQCGALSRSA